MILKYLSAIALFGWLRLRGALILVVLLCPFASFSFGQVLTSPGLNGNSITEGVRAQAELIRAQAGTGTRRCKGREGIRRSRQSHG